MRQERRVRSTIVGLASLALLAACTGDGSSPPTVASPLPTTPPPPVVADDGVLTLAVVVPDSGRGAQLGSALAAGARLAAGDISDGVLGRPVRVIVRPESDDPGTMAAVYRSLADDGVDAIVGPASSTVALATLRSAIDAGLVLCSPTASALGLDDYPDDGRFVRTVPSDSLQAIALAREVEQTGGRTAVVAYLDDQYGAPMAEATTAALGDRGIEVVAKVGFVATEESTSDAAATIDRVQPDTVVVIADVDGGALLINAVDLRRPRATFVVNDAQRRPEQSPPFLDGRVTGVAPAAAAPDQAFLDRLLAVDPAAVPWYAANAYDCVTLFALAATAAASTNPGAIAGQIRSVSTSGARCRDFAACAAALAEGRNIDYDGPDEDLDIGTDGDPVRGRFEVFGFDESGVDRTTDTFVVSR